MANKDLVIIGRFEVEEVMAGVYNIGQDGPFGWVEREISLCLDDLIEYGCRTSDRLIQDIFPDMDVDDREFLLSGITPEQWDSMFMEEEVYE